jgi:hypothetical protein
LTDCLVMYKISYEYNSYKTSSGEVEST